MTFTRTLGKNIWVVIAIAGLDPLAFAGSSLVSGGTNWVSSENNGGGKIFNVSVYPKCAGYFGVYDSDGKPPGEVSTDPFNNPVRAYRFWAVTKDSKRVETLAMSGKVVGEMQFTIDRMRADQAVRLWVTSDPNGIDFSLPPDYSDATTVVNIVQANGSVDVSGMASGSIYIIYGAYRSQPQIKVKMSGSNKAKDIDLGDIHNGDFSNNNEYYIARVDFVNEDGYRTVDWELPKGANYRFSGIVVTSPVPIR